MLGNVGVNGVDEFIDAFENAAADALLGDFGKPVFDLIEPGTALAVFPPLSLLFLGIRVVLLLLLVLIVVDRGGARRPSGGRVRAGAGAADERREQQGAEE